MKTSEKLEGLLNELNNVEQERESEHEKSMEQLEGTRKALNTSVSIFDSILEKLKKN